MGDRALTLQEIADLLLDAVADDCREAGLKTLRIHLRPLVADHGDMPVTEADARFLLGFKRKLCERYKPRTVNCYLTAAKRLIRWAASMGFRDPVDLSAVRQTQVPVPSNKSMTAEELASMFYRSELLDQRVSEVHKDGKNSWVAEEEQIVPFEEPSVAVSA